MSQLLIETSLLMLLGCEFFFFFMESARTCLHPQHLPQCLSHGRWMFNGRMNRHVCRKKVEVLVAQSCLTLCNPMDCSLSDSSVHGILQARILEWVDTFPSPGDLLDPGLKPESPALQADSLPSESLKFHLLTFQCPYFISGKVGSCLLKKCSSTLLFVFVLFFGKETSF